MREADLSLFTEETLTQGWNRARIYEQQMRLAVARADERVAQGEKPQPIAKIGFLVHRRTCAMHFMTTWQHLPKDSFDIVLFDDGYEPDLFEFIAELGLSVAFCEDLANGLFQYVSGISHRDLPVCKRQGYSMVGDLTRLLSYGFSKSRACPFNDTAAQFIVQGDEQVAQYRGDYPDTPQLVAGYARLDGLAACQADKEAIKAKYRLDPAKPVVVWMPTHSGPLTGAITLYSRALVAMTPHINILLKPHPESFHEPPDCHYLRALVEDGNLRVIRDPDDEAEIFAIADIVLTDLGGTLFGAIYAGNDVVVTDVGRPDEISPLEREIWPHTPILTTDTIGELVRLASDPGAFAAQRPVMDSLRQRLFAAGTEGQGGRLIAEMLQRRFAAAMGR
ncbi:CDP-glycerol glycerophosphotransferase family protein [Magnetospirillum moscoviense]|uniref:CDP-glycerol--glycerophosphate glycerophosphotransferase n=1 Tax=Magnetospirillum moscoviense TaxID=1437059 RepID=A0A178M9C0_9PROT|nr:CDP-glycerol glycerophosphotransferase family protein [Magnetospirillum moscoviense]MBF0324300.1 CDP-glycerol glycerophosphotransferase family protein [Alphaproteobacteria bacterium]OAN45381.1 hypothetical protein A6A05_04480 [Magnetospirillum moscoviense]